MLKMGLRVSIFNGLGLVVGVAISKKVNTSEFVSVVVSKTGSSFSVFMIIVSSFAIFMCIFGLRLILFLRDDIENLLVNGEGMVLISVDDSVTDTGSFVVAFVDGVKISKMEADGSFSLLGFLNFAFLGL